MNRMDRQKNSRMRLSNAVNRRRNASRLRKYRLHDREQPETSTTKKLQIEAALPLFLFSRRSTTSDGRAFPSLPLYVLLLRPYYLGLDLIWAFGLGIWSGRSAMLERRNFG